MVPDVRRDSAERWTYGAGAPWVALSTEGRGPALERAPRREAGGIVWLRVISYTCVIHL